MRRPVASAAIAIAIGIALNPGAVSADGWQCPAKPIEPCTKRHGRLSSQNGIALRIWLIGSTRMVALDNDSDQLPAPVRRYLEITSPDHSYIFGDFTICPLEVDRPGHIRRVCVVGAEKLVVQNLRGSRPPFRLLSTWPKEPANAQEATAIRAAKQAVVRELDPAAPRVPFEAWLKDVAANGPTSWEVNDCGEQTGDPALDKGRDFPMCVEAVVALPGQRELRVSLVAGTFSKGAAGRPNFWSAVVRKPDGSVEWIKRLSDVPSAIR